MNQMNALEWMGDFSLDAKILNAMIHAKIKM
jgi:hypothetical protein